MAKPNAFTRLIRTAAGVLFLNRQSGRGQASVPMIAVCLAVMAVQLVLLSSPSRADDVIGPSARPSVSNSTSVGDLGIYVIPFSNLDPEHIRSLVAAICKTDDREPAKAASVAAGIGHVQSVLVESRTNALVLVANVTAVDNVRRLIKELDSIGEETHEVVKVFQLTTQTAEIAARILNTLFGRANAAAPLALPGPTTRATDIRCFSAVADRKSNTLFVIAALDVMKHVEEIVERMEPNGATENVPKLALYRLEHTHAKKITALLMSLFHFDGFPPSNDPDFEFEQWFFNAVADEESETIFITGSRNAVQTAIHIIEALDRSPISRSITPVRDEIMEPPATQPRMPFDLSRPGH